MDKKSMIVICGATGVGKSDFAEQLADQVSGEIVNIDLGQFYTPLSIGTAKPDWKHARIPHHLFDILDEPTNFTVVAYRDQLLKKMNELWGRGVLPIVVGGSAFYLKSLFFLPLSDELSDVEDAHDSYTWDDLNAVDPDRAAVLHKNDTYRIDRAMAIWNKTGTKPSEYQPQFDMPCSATILFLTRDRKELYDRIDERVRIMVNQGWLDEVKPLCNTKWDAFLREKKLIGYNELLDYLAASADEQDLEQVIEAIQQRTRHYAKRQETFWRSLEKELHKAYEKNTQSSYHLKTDTVNLTLLDLNLYIKQLSNELKHR